MNSWWCILHVQNNTGWHGNKSKNISCEIGLGNIKNCLLLRNKSYPPLLLYPVWYTKNVFRIMYRKWFIWYKLIILSHVLFCNDLSISVNVEHPLCVKAYCFCLIKYNMLMTWPSKSFEACQAQLRTFIISMKLSKSYNTYKLNYIRE